MSRPILLALLGVPLTLTFVSPIRGYAQSAAAPAAAPAKAAAPAAAPTKEGSAEAVKGEHAVIDVGAAAATEAHTQHPDAQWFPQAGLGLFIHWGIASVRAMNISWPMIDRGEGAATTPNEYWAQAKDFNPQKYDPNKWLKAAKQAGFTYAVLTTRHHEGFALWPTAFGDFNTKNFMGGRDLVKDYVEACRKNGLKVGFYYSPPDWYFDREYMNFTRKEGATRGPDGLPRTTQKTPAEEAKHRVAYIELVRGQIEELLTRYGKIDLLWFDGRPRGINGDEVITIDRIRELQPGIVVNPRLHRRGDYKTFERKLTTDKPVKGWAEFCDTWTNYWPHVDKAPFRAPGFVLGKLATSRSLNVNYLLGIGPTRDGDLVEDIYKNMTVVGSWMKKHAAAVKEVTALPEGEKASVPATAAGASRFLFVLPAFKDDGRFEKDRLPPADSAPTLSGVPRPVAVRHVATGAPLKHIWADGVLTVELPVGRRTPLVDVVRVDLPVAVRPR